METGATTTEKALDLVKWAQSSSNTRLGDADLYSGRLGEIEQELLDHQSREGIFSEEEGVLSKLDPEDVQRLLSRTASIVPDMAVPMRRSADVAVFSSTRSKAPVLRLDERTAKMISSKKLDADVYQFEGRVRAYDVDIGVGKFISDQLERPLNFSVPQVVRELWKDNIVEAMMRDRVILFGQRYLDRAGLPTSILFNSIQVVE